MDTNTIVIISALAVSTITIILSVFVLIQNQNKKIDEIKNELVDYKMITNDRFSQMDVRLTRIEMRLDRIEENKNSMILM